jgi:DNA mismatch repair protein MSH5
MKQWFLRPSLSLETINSRQTAVECFLRSENRSCPPPSSLRSSHQSGLRAEHVVDAMQSNFRLIKNTPRVVKTLASGRGGLKDWQTIWQVLYGTIMIRDAALNLVHRREVEVVEKVRLLFLFSSFVSGS